MSTTLYLRADERAIFDGLAAALKRGMSVVEEGLRYSDDDRKQRVRASMGRTHDEGTPALLAKLATCKSPEEMEAAASGMSLSEEDVLEAAFLMGPDGLTKLLHGRLRGAKTTDDIADAAEFSELRHALLLSLQAD